MGNKEPFGSGGALKSLNHKDSCCGSIQVGAHHTGRSKTCDMGFLEGLGDGKWAVGELV